MGRRTHPFTLRKRGSTYYVRFRHEGARSEKCTGETSRRAALASAAKIYAEAVRDRGGQRVATGGSFDAAVLDWLEDLDPIRSDEWIDTLALYAKTHWQRWHDLKEVTSAAVQTYIADRLRAGASAGTVRKELSGLNGLLGWAHEQGLIAELPTWKSPTKKSDFESVCLTADEMRRVLEQLRPGPREYYEVMWSNAFRKGTIERLLWSDVDLKARTIRVRPSADKRQDGRTVPIMTGEAHAALDELAPGVGLVFGRRDHRGSLNTAARAAGLTEWLTNHAIRHSRITDLVRRSRDIASIQRLVGHRDLASTMRYVHIDLEAMRELAEEVKG